MAGREIFEFASVIQGTPAPTLTAGISTDAFAGLPSTASPCPDGLIAHKSGAFAPRPAAKAIGVTFPLPIF